MQDKREKRRSLVGHIVVMLFTVASVLQSADCAVAGTLNTVAGTGTTGNTGNGGAATSAQIGAAVGAFIDTTGVKYVADKFYIRKIDTSGIITAQFGTGSTTYAGDGGAATSAGGAPNFLCGSSTGVMYVSDASTTFRKIDTFGIVTKFAGGGTTNVVNVKATSALLSSARCCAVATDGNVYLAFGGQNQVKKVDVSTDMITTFAGTGTSSSTGNGGMATSATFGTTYGLHMDSVNQYLYILDYAKSNLRKVSFGSNIVTAVAGQSSDSIAGDGGPATAAYLYVIPAMVSGDLAGNIFISQAAKHNIRYIDGTTGIINQFAGSSVGTSGNSGNGGAATAGLMNSPYDLKVFGGCVYVPESANFVLRAVTYTLTSAAPTVAPTIVPTVMPSIAPTLVPTVAPTVEPSVLPTAAPTLMPTVLPTLLPTVVPSVAPSSEPTKLPTVAPTVMPTIEPTAEPSVTIAPSAVPTTLAPTVLPTIVPTVVPTVAPSLVPTVTPTLAPTVQPTVNPTVTPTVLPTVMPTVLPTVTPSVIPTVSPTLLPTELPTLSPTTTPSVVPSTLPTVGPSEAPTLAPTVLPTLSPTVGPSVVPTLAPTDAPTVSPTEAPSVIPSVTPSQLPTVVPTLMPSAEPSIAPTLMPTVVPTIRPTVSPTIVPTVVPSVQPSEVPSFIPSEVPTKAPSAVPSMGPIGPTVGPTQYPTTAAPSFAPTLDYVDISFDASIWLNNITVTVLDTASQNAVVAAVASTLDVDKEQVTFLSQDLKGVQGRRRLLEFYQLVVSVNVWASTRDFEAATNQNASFLFSKLQNTLFDAVDSNVFALTFRGFAAEYNATGTLFAGSLNVTVTDYVVVTPSDADDDAENDSEEDYVWTAGAIAGVVIGGVVFLWLLMMGLCFCLRGRSSRTKPHVQIAQSGNANAGVMGASHANELAV